MTQQPANADEQSVSWLARGGMAQCGSSAWLLQAGMNFRNKYGELTLAIDIKFLLSLSPQAQRQGLPSLFDHQLRLRQRGNGWGGF